MDMESFVLRLPKHARKQATNRVLKRCFFRCSSLQVKHGLTAAKEGDKTVLMVRSINHSINKFLHSLIHLFIHYFIDSFIHFIGIGKNW